MSTERMIGALASFGSGWVLWLLGALAAFAAAAAIERSAVLLLARGDVSLLRRDLISALARGDAVAARTCVVTSRTVEAAVLAAGLGALPRGVAAVDERLASEVRRVGLELEGCGPVLGMVGVIAAPIGVLGALLDLSRALHGVDELRAAPLAAVQPELSSALTCLAIGLLVATPALALSCFFRRVVERRIVRAEALGREMLSYLKDQRRPVALEAPYDTLVRERDRGGRMLQRAAAAGVSEG
jgi:biopolymer transport protein ExbB